MPPLQAPTTRLEDVETMDAILHAMCQVISVPAGQKRDWDRCPSLFLPGARLILPVTRRGEKPRARVLEVEDYVRRSHRIFEKEDFWGSEKEHKTES